MQFSFQIGEEIYIVPEDLTVERFGLAISWDLSDEKNYAPFVSAITNCPLPALNLVDDIVFSMILKACIDSIPTNRELVHQIGSYRLMDVDNITFGQFVDLDILIADGVAKHVVELASILYGVSIDIAAALPVNEVWPTILWLYDWRRSVYRDYDEFFEASGPKEGTEEKTTINNLQLMWYEGILVLAEGQFLNIHKVVERPMREALNFLTWRKAQVQKQRVAEVKRKLRK